MRIAIFTETYLPDANGVATHVKTLKDGLEALGHDVLIVTADASCRRHVIRSGILHCPAVTSKRLYNYSLAAPFSLKRMKIIKRWQPDIIHIQNEFGTGLSGVMAAGLLGIPLVYTMHTMYDSYIYYVAPRPFISAATRASHRYFRHIANRCTALTGASEKIERYIRECGIKQPVRIIPNAVELDIFGEGLCDMEKAAEIRRRYGLKRTSACFCGRLGEEKNLDTLLAFWAEASKQLNDISLLIIGDGPHREHLAALTQKLSISDSVRFTGKIPHNELPEYYAACSLYVTASLTENYSISMLEALASGLPVVHMLDELNECQLINGMNGFPFTSEQEFVTILSSLSSMSDEERKRLSDNIRLSVKNSGAKELAEYIVDVYSSICGGRAVVRNLRSFGRISGSKRVSVRRKRR